MTGDPFTDMLEDLRDEILEGVRSIVRSALEQPSTDDSGLDPFQLYTAQEAADVLGLDRATMYEIPEAELPRCDVGPARGATRWMGADLLAYSRGLDPVDYESVLEDVRSELRRTPASTSEPKDGPTRVV
jgi:hypothetical protein